ncbi:hypothetical protein PGTUg99_003283 [Puccinia graminis f. sp. tritici]|uniref:Uncharacterized protein n=1 Tax=Puccinia graminis f. sp. tritici TaxID=56615 RepID=A0A5B0PPP9_PUCGR|nr:hypothetical protein PGTUg99_003283 [Puccinia graminis f. sp. tritici]
MQTAYISTLNEDIESLKTHLSDSICRPVWWAETLPERPLGYRHPSQRPTKRSQLGSALTLLSSCLLAIIHSRSLPCHTPAQLVQVNRA